MSRLDREVGRRTVLTGLGGVTLAAIMGGCARPGPGLPLLPAYLPRSGSARVDAVADVCVVGGTPSGVAAAVAAARLGSRVVLLSADDTVGGAMSGGLAASDVGYAQAIRGFAREVFQRIGAAYGSPAGYEFEPHVAEATFLALLQESRVRVLRRQRVVAVHSDANHVIQGLDLDGGGTVQATSYVDATYEGDLMAHAGVSWTQGREASAQYGESLAGVQAPAPGGFAGDLTGLFGYAASAPGELGSASTIGQAFTFRLTLTRDPANRLPVPQPPQYDAARFAPLADYMLKTGADPLVFQTPLPNGKFDLNSRGLLSTDFVGGQGGWATADAAGREAIFAKHVEWQMGLITFLQNDASLPSAVRTKYQGLGLCRDEFEATGGWSPTLYIREARRLVGRHVLTQADVQGRGSPADAVALGSYPIDSHACTRVTVDGVATTEGGIFEKLAGPYGIPFGALQPRPGEAANLLVSTCVSSSHVALSSVRVEPTLMMLGQAAGAASAVAVYRRAPVNDLAFDLLAPRIHEALA
jgi:hypothetical protein